MTMRAILWRHRHLLTAVSFPLALAALVLLLAGRQESAITVLGCYVVVAAAKEIIDWRCKPTPPRLGSEELAAIRSERDSAGEQAAIRMVRDGHPDLGPLEAAVLVRHL